MTARNANLEAKDNSGRILIARAAELGQLEVVGSWLLATRTWRPRTIMA